MPSAALKPIVTFLCDAIEIDCTAVNLMELHERMKLSEPDT